MENRQRKLYVWLISIGAILVIYLFYNWISRTPPIEVVTEHPSLLPLKSEEAGDSNVGVVGGVGIGPVQKAKYSHLNSKKQVDREFGFEKLLHAEGDEWEIEKPYMNIYRRNLKLFMTADEGKVQVEDAVGRATPKDATLTGNVVIHILPPPSAGRGSIKEGFIYLDDVIFISEKSQFSSAGPVKFTSKDAQMLGRGLELVYNDELDRLEYLKIIELETLRIRGSAFGNKSRNGSPRQSSKASLFSSQASNAAPPSAGRGSRVSQPEANRDEKIEQRETRSKGQRTKGGEYYKCVFKKNVTIDSPEQLIFADEVSISDILWSKVSDENSESGETPAQRWAEPFESNKSPNQFADVSGVAEAKSDIVVTCDDGIIVVPMNSPGISENVTTSPAPIAAVAEPEPGSKSRDFVGGQLVREERGKGRPTFTAQKIDYSLITEAVVASKPSELTFYINDITGAEGEPAAPSRDELRKVPVTITAREKATFLPRLNKVIFEGNVLCNMLRENVNFQQKYTLSAPKLTVDLFKDEQSRTAIKHLIASGEVVQLDTSKWAREELLGFTKLKCLQFDYDAAEQMFLAAGSGIIAIDNSKIAEPKNKVGKFSLQRPCYAVVRNFDTLTYLKDVDLIIADAGNEQILIDYFPVVKGKQEQQTSATANHIEAVLYETAGGQTELETLKAKGGITYEEQRPKKGKSIQFVGSEMFYDSSKSMITAWGDKSQPCFLNGALAPGIEYNLKNNKIKTKIISPGMLQMGR
jgi:hypothetical protein